MIRHQASGHAGDELAPGTIDPGVQVVVVEQQLRVVRADGPALLERMGGGNVIAARGHLDDERQRRRCPAGGARRGRGPVP